MDYSLLLAVHNITEEMKSTQQIPVIPSREITLISSDTITNTSSSIHEEITTTSTDSGIAMTIISNLPTYIQYLRVIEFIRAQQDPSITNIETASITTVKPDLSPIFNTKSNDEQTSSTNLMLRVNSTSPMNHSSTSSSFHLANGLIGGDVWYHRQNLSRLTMYVSFFDSNQRFLYE
jgi:hypothetical protein